MLREDTGHHSCSSPSFYPPHPLENPVHFIFIIYPKRSPHSLWFESASLPAWNSQQCPSPSLCCCWDPFWLVLSKIILGILLKESSVISLLSSKASRFLGSLGGAAVWRLPLAWGAILETQDRIPRQAPGAWSLLLPLPVSLPLSL